MAESSRASHGRGNSVAQGRIALAVLAVTTVLLALAPADPALSQSLPPKREIAKNVARNPLLRPLLEGRSYTISGIGAMGPGRATDGGLVSVTITWQKPFSAEGNWPWPFPTKEGFAIFHVRIERLKQLLLAYDLDNHTVLWVTLDKGRLLEQTRAPAAWVPWLTKRAWVVTVVTILAAAVAAGVARQRGRKRPSPGGALDRELRFAFAATLLAVAALLTLSGLGHIYNWGGHFRQDEDYSFEQYVAQGLTLYLVPALLFVAAGVFALGRSRRSFSRVLAWAALAALAAYGLTAMTIDVTMDTVVDRTFLLLWAYGFLLVGTLAQLGFSISPARTMLAK